MLACNQKARAKPAGTSIVSSQRGRRSKSAWQPARQCATRCRCEQRAAYAPRPGRDDPVRILERQNASRLQAAGADPPRAHAGVALRLPARLGGRHGGRPRPDAGHRRSWCRPAATCMCPTSACMPRPSAGSSSASTTSTRPSPAPWEWDLKRLAASAAVAHALPRRRQGQSAEAAARGTCAVLPPAHPRATPRWATSRSGTRASTSERCSTRLAPKARQRARADHRQGTRQRTNIQVLEKMAELVDGQHRILEDRAAHRARDPYRGRARRSSEALDASLRGYLESLRRDRRRAPRRATGSSTSARKVVGVGSVGTRCWSSCCRARRRRPAVPAGQGGAGFGARSRMPSEAPVRATRASASWPGQRLIQGAPDIFLGWGETGAASSSTCASCAT